MNTFTFGAAVIVTLATVVIQLAGSAQMEPKDSRHWSYLIPVSYHDAKSPTRATSESLATGARLYVEYCSRCHGKNGGGRGRSPGLLNYLAQTPEARDESLFRVISAGRRRMPAYKNKLQEDEIWQIVSYMRSGFPSVESAQ